MKPLFGIHSDLKDERSEALNAAIANVIQSTEGFYGCVLGSPDLLEHYRQEIKNHYLELGRAISEVTDLYLDWTDFPPEPD